MPLKPRRETPIERIFREVTGRKMPATVKRVLLPKRGPSGPSGSEPSLQCGKTMMIGDEWIKTLPDGRRVKFTNQELQDEWMFITAQVERNQIVYSIMLTDVKNSLSRGEVERQFEDELSKK